MRDVDCQSTVANPWGFLLVKKGVWLHFSQRGRACFSMCVTISFCFVPFLAPFLLASSYASSFVFLLQQFHLSSRVTFLITSFLLLCGRLSSLPLKRLHLSSSFFCLSVKLVLASLSPQVKGWMFISQNYYNDNKLYFIDPIVLSLCPWHLMTPWHFAGGTANWTAHPGVRRWLLIGHTWTRVPEVGLFCASQSRYFFPNSYLLYIRFMDLALC